MKSGIFYFNDQEFEVKFAIKKDDSIYFCHKIDIKFANKEPEMAKNSYYYAKILCDDKISVWNFPWIWQTGKGKYESHGAILSEGILNSKDEMMCEAVNVFSSKDMSKTLSKKTIQGLYMVFAEWMKYKKIPQWEGFYEFARDIRQERLSKNRSKAPDQ